VETTRQRFCILLCVSLVSAALAGCGTTRQLKVDEGRGTAVLFPYNDGSLGLTIDALDPSRWNVVSEGSYAENSRGKQFKLLFLPNDFARRHPEKPDIAHYNVWLLDANAAHKKTWDNGRWKIVILLKSREGFTETRRLSFLLKNMNKGQSAAPIQKSIHPAG
jgi:hypothetical protein